MDRIIKITMSIFLVILVAFISLSAYNGYVETAYRSSLVSTYSYSCTITTDMELTNVTLFIPVPANVGGNSPVIAQLSAHKVSGIPDTWKTELYETGKSTLVKVSIPALVPPAGTSSRNPYSVTFTSGVSSRSPIDTENPIENSPLFRPVQNLKQTECKDSTGGSTGQCYSYLTSLYADYMTNPNAAVTVRSSLVGNNQWKVFEPQENEYRTDISVLMFGEQNGWTTMRGNLEQSIGVYGVPTLHV